MPNNLKSSDNRRIKTAYFNCFSGISGDMTLAAFVHLGVPISWLTDKLSTIPSLKLENFKIIEKKKMINGISSVSIHIDYYNRTHHRDYRLIKSIIQESPLSSFVKKKSIAIFHKIAEAEAGIHDVNIEKVIFHEIGGIDSIIDIVGTALCLEYLGIEKICASKIPFGNGAAKTAHGTIPVPVPAALDILKGIPVYGLEIDTEITTPTGAAIIAALSENFGAVPDMIIEKTGYGAGKKNLGSRANLLSIILGYTLDKNHNVKNEKIVVIEANIDDANPEFLGFVMERLFSAGALDVCFIPVFMKKNRPGTIIKILSSKEKAGDFIDIIFREKLSSGVRYYEIKRKILEREEITVETEFGTLKAKKIINPDGSFDIIPEYEECRKKALRLDIPIKIIYDQIIRK